MATESSDQSKGEGAAVKSGSSFPFLPLLNTIALAAALGTLYYTRISFKRQTITEETERARLDTQASPTPPPVAAQIPFDTMTVNIASPQAANGKLRYATIGFSLEIRDKNEQDTINTLRPIILDRILFLLGKKQFHELTTVQGRYNLRSQIMDLVNRIVNEASEKPTRDLVTNVYFTQLTAQ